MLSIRNFTPRLYQETILASCAKSNCLIILPTGLGKTKTAILVAAQRLNLYPQSKILFLTVTKPLAEQITKEARESLTINEDEVALFTGSVAPEKRAQLFKHARVIVSTPQCIENDFINKRVYFEDVSLLVIDEAHNAVGDYAYTWIAKQYQKISRFPRIIGLTASPGSDLDKIKEVCTNLSIEDIEIRTDKDPDVRPYVHDIELTWVEVVLPPPFLDVSRFLRDFIKSRLEKLKEMGILQKKNLAFVTKTELLGMQSELRGRASLGEKDPTIWSGISTLAEIIKMYHALELIETQGVIPAYHYLQRLDEESKHTTVKAVQNLVRDLNYRSALVKMRTLFEEKIEHPKLVQLQKIIEKEMKENKGKKIIVFNQYRESAQDIVEHLNRVEDAKAQLFVGQLKKGETGLSQKEQKMVLDNFRSGQFNVLVATSIAEQGLDIPEVDTVIFFEPIPSAIRHIQRRGRTGRHAEGKVIVLMTKNTVDEGYRWSAHHKERQMYRNLESLKQKLDLYMHSNKVQQTLSVPVENKIKIVADHREKGTGIIKELVELDINLSLESLENADYILSSKVGVEFKKVEDFVQSIIDGRVLDQIKNLKNNFERPLLMIEGVEDVYSVRNVHANAIRGMFAAIAIGYGVPILYTKNPKDSALMLQTIARREQEESGKDFSLHPQKKTLSIKEQQEYIVSSLPGIGPTLSKPLLKHFKSVKNVVNAPQKDLETIEMIGKKKAEKIREIIDRDYQVLE